MDSAIRIPHSAFELSWFSPLCDDDYKYLGVPDTRLRSSFPHCRDILLKAEANGFNNILCPNGGGQGELMETVASPEAPP
jgi:sulfoquinovose monooxygenase